MRALKLAVQSFRNLKPQEIDLDHDITLILGDNGQGKSSIIEAIWLFSCAKSFRGASDGDMIAFEADKAGLKFKADCEGVTRTMQIQLQRGRRKEIYIGADKISRSSDLIGGFVTVLFEPDHLGFISGSPERRRRMINISLCQCSKIYTATLSQYNKILNSRAALLKGGYSSTAEQTLDVWDEGLCRRAARIILERGRYMEELNKAADTMMQEISSGKENLSIQYKNSYYKTGITEEEIFGPLYQSMKRSRKKDWDTGVTEIGPHRDDVEILIGGVPAKRFASTGQKRSAVIAVKLAECEVIKNRLGVKPVFLLDDVLSELDEGRKEFILSHIRDYQVIITDCGRQARPNGAAILKVTDGKTEVI